MKFSTKDTMLIIIGVVIIIVMSINIHNIRSEINYLDIPCPCCGSDEVGNFGTEYHGHSEWTKGHCFDCSTEFYVEE